MRKILNKAFVIRAADAEKESSSRWLKQAANPAKREALAQRFGLAPRVK